MQKESFIDENKSRLESEISRLNQEKEEIKQKQELTAGDVKSKQAEIEDVNILIKNAAKKISECSLEITKLKTQRDAMNSSHKVFFEKREKLNEHITDLDKEVYRLNSGKEKLEESSDSITDYMWSEYELTYSYALELKNPEFDNLSSLKKEIHSLLIWLLQM